MRKVAILFMGLPGSGKTTLGRFLESHVKGGRYIDQQDVRFGVYAERVKDALQQSNTDIVLLLGKCHMTRSQRNKTMSLLQDIPVIVVHLKCAMKTCIKRCMTREKGTSSLDYLSRAQVEHVVRIFGNAYQKVDAYERRKYLCVVTLNTKTTIQSNQEERLLKIVDDMCNIKKKIKMRN